jgi:hypothetical protein
MLKDKFIKNGDDYDKEEKDKLTMEIKDFAKSHLVHR